MKRSDIKMTPTIARDQVKRFLPELQEALAQRVVAGQINRYQANQELLAYREYLDILDKMIAVGEGGRKNYSDD